MGIHDQQGARENGASFSGGVARWRRGYLSHRTVTSMSDENSTFAFSGRRRQRITATFTRADAEPMARGGCLNTTSHDEANYSRPFERSSVSRKRQRRRVTMIFYGQELRHLWRYFGFSRSTSEFRQAYTHFKKIQFTQASLDDVELRQRTSSISSSGIAQARSSVRHCAVRIVSSLTDRRAASAAEFLGR